MPTLSPSRIADLVVANHILAAHGIVDAFGHVSVRAVDPAQFLLARSMAPALVAADDILDFDLDGEIVGGRRAPPYLERFIHAGIYRVRRDVGAVVHSHSAEVIPFGVTATALRPIFHMSAFLGDGVPVFEIRDGAGDTDMLIRDASLGEALAGCLGEAPAVLQRGHGVTVVGSTLRQAVFRAIYLQTNARLQAGATQLGPITFLSAGEAARAARAVDTQVDRAWEMWALDAPSHLPGGHHA